MSSTQETQLPASRGRRWVFWGFLAIAGFYLLTEHRAHLAALWWLPLAFLLLCPLLHMGMHGGHGGHGSHGSRDREPQGPLPPDSPGAPDTPVMPMHRHAALDPKEP